jgi:hypothetical protein
MPTLDDVRAIAMSFPETFEKVDGQRGGAGWRTSAGLFAWERGPSKADETALAARGSTWPEGPVVGVRTDGLEAKEALLGTFPDAFFTIPHFDGYPAVLVRLDEIPEELLREVVTDAWLLKAPKRLAKAWLEEHE